MESAGESHAVMTMFTQRKVQSSPTRRRILIADDQPLVRRGLKAVIDAEPDLIVCGEAATREDGLRAIAAARPDLVVVEPSLVRGDGLELIREIRSCYEGLRVLALTMHEAPLYVRRVFAAGASGYVTKSEKTETLLTAIRSVLSGGTYRGARDLMQWTWGISPYEN